MKDWSSLYADERPHYDRTLSSLHKLFRALSNAQRYGQFRGLLVNFVTLISTDFHVHRCTPQDKLKKILVGLLSKVGEMLPFV